MKLRLPRWARGDTPKAADLNALSAAIERLANLQVDGTNGLQLSETATGWALSLALRTRFAIAVVTTTCPALSGSTFGQGTAALEILSYTTAGVCTRAAANPARSLMIYNGGAESIPVGRRVVLYEDQPGKWHVIVNYCP